MIVQIDVATRYSPGINYSRTDQTFQRPRSMHTLRKRVRTVTLCVGVSPKIEGQ